MKDSADPSQPEAVHQPTLALLAGLASGYLAGMLALALLFLLAHVALDFAALSGLAFPSAAFGALSGLVAHWFAHRRGRSVRAWLYCLAAGALAGLLAGPAALFLLSLFDEV